MGRTVATAIMVLVGFGVLAGSAAAQGTTVYEFTDADAWWESFDCDTKRDILGMDGDGTDAIMQAGEDVACKMTLSGLSRTNARIVEDFIDPATDTTVDGTDNQVGQFASTKAWWNAVGAESSSGCAVRQALVGVLPIATVPTSAGGESTTPDNMLFCRDYDGTGGLRPAEKDMVDMIGMYLSGQGMPTDDEEAPALPLVGVGLLGLLLAGRGAWLRRRNG